jgi:hypothetical protein
MQKAQGQTDKRILALSYKDFEDEFGFKPKDKIEQRHFANMRERLTDPRTRKTLEEMDKIRKAAAKRRQAQ